jgi:phosphoenolpyruvate---glycerone phosphotransferase subunit DhaM
MIGLVIVSHSQKIAEGVKELAEQMTQGQVPMVAAGGMGEGVLGTNAEAIRAAADQLAAGGVDGILVLVDLGSAVMSAEMALEDLSTPYVLSDAPLVEGALMAAVEASIGADLNRVAEVARQTRELRKLQH